MQHIKNTSKSGFTLLELVIIFKILALVGWIGISASRDLIDNANQTATQNRLDTIEKALFTFWQKNGRLPCPADPTLASSNASYGVEVSNSSNYDCKEASSNFSSATNLYKAAEGMVPVTTLGLPKDFVFDSWKRKIGYAVTPEFTFTNARTAIPVKSSSCVANTAIRIKDAGGSDRSVSAVYALISYGKNGHGGYPATGSTRYNASSTNTDEQTNCHCNGSAANATYDGNYVQKTLNFNTVTVANYFDDIVRYKERWQLATTDDVINDDGYRGPDLAVGYNKAATGTVYVYKNQCGVFVKQSDLSPAPTNIPRGIAFTAKNKHLLVYSGAGCNLYKINASGTLTNQSSAFSTACPYNATAVMDFANNGYLAISTSTASAVVNLWKQAGDKFVALSSLTHSAASVAGLSFSPDAQLLAVRSATTTSKIYKRKGNSFSAAAADITQPTDLSFYDVPKTLTFSPDGRYLSSLENWAAKSVDYLQNWRVLGDKYSSFTTLQAFTPYSAGTINSLSFSQDGRYFVMSVGNNSSYVCKIDPSDVICSTLTLHASGYYYSSAIVSNEAVDDSGVANYSFSKDSNYLIVSREVANNVPEIIRRHGVSSFRPRSRVQSDGSIGTTPVRNLDQILSASTGGPVAFSK